jgi:DNA-directed RNA polymerase specialized sigma24 family protein
MTADDPLAPAAEKGGDPPGLTVDRGLVERGLNRLQAARRRVIEMAFFEGLTQSEIAAGLGEPLGHREDPGAAGTGTAPQRPGGEQEPAR